MDTAIRAKIDHAHALASAMTVIVSFCERPDFLGGPLSVGDAIKELARQGIAVYGVTFDQMVNEWERITGDEVE
jgi:hypothetical protein